MRTTIQRVNLPENRRILILSDPHAHAEGLKAVLRGAGFSRKDVLILLGDLIEKGKESLKLLRFVMALCRTHTVYPLMGNVDLWRVEFLKSDDPAKWAEYAASSLERAREWGGSLLHDLYGELGEPLTPDTDITALFPRLQKHFAPEIDFLSSLPTVLETQRMIFVHGGVPHERLDELLGTYAHALLKFDAFYGLGLSFHKYVVTGHWPAVLYSPTYPVFSPLIDRERRVVCADGACGVKFEGQLNLISLPSFDSEDFSFTAWDALPTITALDAQASSPPDKARYLRWDDYAVALISRGEEISQVMFRGAPMEVPTQFIFHHDGQLRCTDTTDYLIEASPGDRMSLILPLSDRCYVKKNNVTGWYFGRYETNGGKNP